MQAFFVADFRAFITLGKEMAINVAIIATVNISSISVNPAFWLLFLSFLITGHANSKLYVARSLLSICCAEGLILRQKAYSSGRRNSFLTKEKNMKTQLRPVDPVKAKEYFEDKITFTTGPIELDRMLKEDEDLVVIDVRDAEDYEKGHIPGAINLPRERWETLEGLQK